MHVLPLEIQHNIFVLACTDGGRTGLALFLTSKSYRDAVRPVRLHSVTVRAFSHIEGVLQSYHRDQGALEARGSTLKPRVRHLLLSPVEKKPRADEEAFERYRAPAIALLQLVGPTLTTLAYTMRFRFTGLASICPMPKLEELTVLLNPCTRRNESELGLPHPPASYPALRKLHIVMWFGTAVPDLLGWWAEAAPGVADLRLTNVESRDGGEGWVECMIDHDHTKRPYPSVRRMFIEPYQKPLGGRCGNPRVEHWRFLTTLEEMRKRTPEDIQFVLEERESKGQPFDYVADVERYWMDGVNGGLGAWRQSDEAAEADA